jgi:hypothetical protein
MPKKSTLSKSVPLAALTTVAALGACSPGSSPPASSGVAGRDVALDTAQPQQSEARPQAGDTGSIHLSVTVPRYQVVARVHLMSGGTFGDILLPSVRQNMPIDRLAAIALAIVSKENLVQAEFYRSESARKANSSASYAKTHPGALEKGHLGSIEDGQFKPTPYLYDPRFQQ